MALDLVPPGHRRNKFWLVYGRLDGTMVEKSTGTLNKQEARAFLRRLERGQILTGPAAKSGNVLPIKPVARPSAAAAKGDEMTLGQAVRQYAAGGRKRGGAVDIDCPTGGAAGAPERMEAKRLKRLIEKLGDRPLSSLRQHDFDQLAHKTYPTGAASTKNREIMRSASAVIHYAAKNRWCPLWQVELFREQAPGDRWLSAEEASLLINAADHPKQRLFLRWLFATGMRVGDTLQRAVWPDPSQPGERVGIDLEARLVRWRIGKTDQFHTVPLNDEAMTLLEAIPAAERKGRLFSWGSRQNVNRWLRPLRAATGVFFTPHMARHSVGNWLDEMGANTRDIARVLGQKSLKSAERYTRRDNIDRARSWASRLPRLGGGEP
jgi:integrase